MVARKEFDQVFSPKSGRISPIPEVQFADGAIIDAEVNAKLAKDFSGHLNNMLDDKIARESAQAGVEAAQKNKFRVLQEDTIAAKAYNKAGLNTYTTMLESRSRVEIEKIYEANKHDASELKKKLDGFKAGIMTEINQNAPVLGPTYEAIFLRHSQPLIRQAHRDGLAVVREEEIASTMTAIETNINSGSRYARTEMDDDKYAIGIAGERQAIKEKLLEQGPPQGFEFEGEKIEADAGRSGAIGVDDMQRILADFDDQILMNRVLGKFENTDNKQAFYDNFEATAHDKLGKQLDADQIERIASKMRSDLTRERVERNAQKSILSSEVTDAVFVLERGRVPPGYESLRQAVKDFPELAEDLDIAYKQKEIAAEYRTLTPAEQEQHLLEVIERTREKATRADTELVERLSKIHSETMNALKEDPVQFGKEIGLYDLQPLDFGNPDTFTKRREAYVTLRNQYGIESTGLTDNEILELENHLEAADSAGKLALLSGFESQMHQGQYAALLNEIADDFPAYATAASIGSQAPKLASDIVAGSALVEDPEISKFLPTKIDYQPAVTGYVGNAFMHDGGALTQTIQSALAVDLLRRNRNGKLDDFNSEDFERVLEEVTGGVYEWNGSSIIAPVRGLDESSFEDLMDSLEAEDLKTPEGLSASMPNGETVTPEVLRKYGHLESIGDGLYLVNINGFYAQGAPGQPFELDLGFKVRNNRRR